MKRIKHARVSNAYGYRYMQKLIYLYMQQIIPRVFKHPASDAIFWS